ncbi:3-oxoacyl-[acyl-carrier protein] reductase [Promicromonospora sp. AC04]|uniref:SDR family NAD(P)-dependent oxidoreductase n=1 Tax=Promicromonospora sp. AC04 TaxID=2135723 RepID=UPI000D3CC5F5|nr:SDR family oxidoreductase [Promicromonospora sp. AC04]PUB22265.1 3-oxoacyl-[acyl-carrier protein] reductase [Promicromonospora sp. AC04]
MPRLVLVTGGSGGIGGAVARQFVEQGDTVVITGRDAARLDRAVEMTGARGVRCDVGQPADVEALMAQLDAPVDVLVAMAGGNTDFDGPEPVGLVQVADGWRANIEANLLSTVLVVKAALEDMPAGGAVVTVGSIGAEYAGTSYGVAKAAVQAWTAGLSATVGPRGITANCVAPGYIADTGYFKGRLTDQRRDRLVAATHDRRPGLPEDVASLVSFLASPGARHITGQTLHINGGAHATR